MRRLLTYISILFVVLVSSIFVYRHLYEVTANNIESGMKVEYLLGTLNSNENAYATLKRLRSETDGKIKTIDSYFIREYDIIDFLEKIVLIRDEVGVESSITRLTEQSGDVQSPGGKQMVLDIDVNGSWKNILLFVKYLEALPTNAKIDEIQFGKDGDGGEWKGKITMSASLKDDIKK